MKPYGTPARREMWSEIRIIRRFARSWKLLPNLQNQNIPIHLVQSAGGLMLLSKPTLFLENRILGRDALRPLMLF